MTRRRKKLVRSQDRYQLTSIPGLFLHPTVLLLNLVVITFEDDARTDDLIPPETVDKVTALIRQAYDFPDLDREQGKGVGISFIGQFFNPDDYLEHHIAQTHSEAILYALEGDLQLMPHPAFVPVSRVRRVSQQNAVQWAEQMMQLIEQGKVSELMVLGPPGPSYTVRSGEPSRARRKR